MAIPSKHPEVLVSCLLSTKMLNQFIFCRGPLRRSGDVYGLLRIMVSSESNTIYRIKKKANYFKIQLSKYF